MTYPEVFWGYHLYLKSLFLISREAPSPPFPPMVGAMTMKRNSWTSTFITTKKNSQRFHLKAFNNQDHDPFNNQDHDPLSR